MLVKTKRYTPMTERTPGVLFGFFVGFIILMLGLSSALAGKVTDVRLGENAGKTRFVLDVDQEVKYSYFLLADPYRIVIDLEEITWELDGPGQGEGKGIIRDYRYGLFQPGKSRIVLDLKDPAEVENVFFLSPQSGYPYRLVIDLNPVRRDAFLAAMDKTGSPAAYVPEQREVKIQPKTSQRTIVIDPGHGGVDPGTIAKSGKQEKEVVLLAARQIKEALEATGRYRVLLTRDRDIYIPHRERFEFARNVGADLFISVHADAIANSKIRGATVYTLSEKASDSEAAALARRENKSDLIAGVDLGGESSDVANILVDLAMRETMNYSAKFAGYLVPELRKEVLLRTNSHRFAGFLVLKAPDVPSVLLEMGYMTNSQDAKELSTKKGREKIARAVKNAVDKYFSSVVASAGR